MTIYNSAGDGEYIVEMELCHDSLTDSDRSVIDRRYADFRTNKVLIKKIYRKDNESETLNEIHSDYAQENGINSFQITKYVVSNEPLIDNNFNHNINNIWLAGIHYFESKDAAYFYNNNLINFTGLAKKWNRDGFLIEQQEYVNGKRHGKGISYVDPIRSFWQPKFVSQQAIDMFNELNCTNIIQADYSEISHYVEIIFDNDKMIKQLNKREDDTIIEENIANLNASSIEYKFSERLYYNKNSVLLTSIKYYTSGAMKQQTLYYNNGNIAIDEHYTRDKSLSVVVYNK